MSRFVSQFDLLQDTHAAFRAGYESQALKNTLFLLANGIVKLNASDMYSLYESSVMSGIGSEKLFFTMLEQGMVSEVLQNAKSGNFEILKCFVDQIRRLDEDTRYELLKSV